MRPLLALLLLLAPVPASAQQDDLQRLSRGTAELRSDVGQSHARLRLLEEQLLGRMDGARLTVTQASAVDRLFRLERATYALDGHVVLDRAGGDLVEPLTIYDGVIAPGEHTLSVVLRYRGDGLGVASYVSGYRLTLRSSYVVSAPREGDVEVTVRPFTRPMTVPYEERLRVEYETVTGARD